MLIFKSTENRSTVDFQARKGRLLAIATGIYTTDLVTSPEMQIKANIVPVLSYLRPGCVISHRSALKHDFGASEGVVVVSVKDLPNNWVHELPGIKVIATRGEGPLPGDSCLGKIHVASKARALLENAEARRVIKSIGMPKQLQPDELKIAIKKLFPTEESKKGIEAAIDLIVTPCKTGLPAHGNKLWESERNVIKGMLSSLQNEVRPLFLSLNIDHDRIALFEDLAVQLKRGHGNELLYGDNLASFPNRPSPDDSRFLNMAFFESYFSNYIEGTEFTPEEAREIAEGQDSGVVLSKDGHDIKSLYQLYATPEIFLREDKTPQEFLDNLKLWHASFGDHPGKESITPGKFKNKANRVGSTWFTDPGQVEGTLRQAWEIGNTLSEPVDRSIFRAVSTVSIHPFLDGNGRITRLSASNVLARAGKIHAIIPTVFREDYILAMRAFSNGDSVPIIRAYRRAIEISSSIPFDDLTSWLRDRNAFGNPNEEKWNDLPGRSVFQKPRI